ncbi:MAG: 1-acyl-sn-glycerol-3-phosphate acyltransferase [Clostridiales bacterium]|nr:1-acyl-sn-glycerol-3-phosphate acyltransferase [Clostridiales bacterium]
MKLSAIKNVPLFAFLVGYLVKINGDRKKMMQLRAEGKFAEEKEVIRKIYHNLCSDACKYVGVEVRVQGRENLPPADEPVVFVCNHQSYSDVVAFGAVMKDRQISFIAKESLSKIPFYGKLIQDMRGIFINGLDARSAVEVMRTGNKYLKEGFNMVIFPEGRRSLGPEMGSFKHGSLQLACRAGVRVVPCVINPAWECYETKGYPQPGVIDFAILPPVATKDVPKKEWGALMETIEGQVRSKLEELQAARAAEERK